MSKFWASSSFSSSSSDNDLESEQGGFDSTNSHQDDEGRRTAKRWATEQPHLIWEEIRSLQIFAPVPKISALESSWSSVSASNNDTVRVVCMSDTHGQHRAISVPPCDILIHAGDFTKSGEAGTVADLAAYFRELRSTGVVRRAVVCIAGNHDLTFDPNHYETEWTRFHPTKMDCSTIRSLLVDGSGNENDCIYLQDTETIVKLNEDVSNGDEAKLSIYGSPHTPFFFNWAFNQTRGSERLKALWNGIPESTDILITHGPPLGRGDLCSHGKVVGCHDLLEELQSRQNAPRVHIFGHVHEGYGTSFDGRTLFVNASNLTHQYKPLHHCVVLDIPVYQHATIGEGPALPRVVEPECTLQSWGELEQWFHDNGYASLANYCKDRAGSSAVSLLGNQLLQGEESYFAVLQELEIERDVPARLSLIKALSKLYSQSFAR